MRDPRALVALILGAVGFILITACFPSPDVNVKHIVKPPNFGRPPMAPQTAAFLQSTTHLHWASQSGGGDFQQASLAQRLGLGLGVELNIGYVRLYVPNDSPWDNALQLGGRWDLARALGVSWAHVGFEGGSNIYGYGADGYGGAVLGVPLGPLEPYVHARYALILASPIGS